MLGFGCHGNVCDRLSHHASRQIGSCEFVVGRKTIFLAESPKTGEYLLVTNSNLVTNSAEATIDDQADC
jgi:hypothetical protein